MPEQDQAEKGFDPAKRNLLVVSAGAALGYLASRLMPPGLAHAQRLEGDPTAVGYISQADLPVINTEIGITSDAEVSSLPYSQKQTLDDGLIRYTFPKIPNDTIRPAIVITDGKKAVFKRRRIEDTGLMVSQVDQSVFRSKYGEPSYIIPPPQVLYSPIVHSETQVYNERGFALVVGYNDTKVQEVQVFEPTTFDEYLGKWRQGEYLRDVYPAIVRSLLILVDGLGSSTNGKTPGPEKTFEAFRQSLFSYYDDVIPFSYAGGKVLTAYNTPPRWSGTPHGPERTYQSIFDSADIFGKMLDDYIEASDALQIDILTFSLGGPVALQCLVNRINHSDDGKIRSVILLDGPVNGISNAEVTYFLQTILGTETMFGNEAVGELEAMGGTPEIQNRTTQLNKQSAQILRDRRGIRIRCLTNSDDCLIRPNSAIIPGFGQTISLGRGDYGISNCDNLTLGLAPFLPGDDAFNIGHKQITDDPRAIKAVTDFLVKGIS